MRICVVGSREIIDAITVFTMVDKFIKDHCVGSPVILSGGGRGVDALVKKWAETRGYDFIEYLPYHVLDTTVEFDSKYFFSRTRQMVQNSDKVLAIWNGKSAETIYAIKYSQKIGVPVMVYNIINKE